MKTIGNRRQPKIQPRASGEALVEGARFSESIARLAQSTFIPKGIYRFKTHEAANKHQEDCLARGMALLAEKRSRDRTDQSPGNTRFTSASTHLLAERPLSTAQKRERDDR